MDDSEPLSARNELVRSHLSVISRNELAPVASVLQHCSESCTHTTAVRQYKPVALSCYRLLSQVLLTPLKLMHPFGSPCPGVAHPRFLACRLELHASDLGYRFTVFV